MATKKKSWREKIANSHPPKVVHITDERSTWGTGSMIISSPAVLEELVKEIPDGHIVTIKNIRDCLSERNKTDMACPLTTGIFLRIVAECSNEEETLGIKNGAPWWRIVRDDGSLIDKFPGYPDNQLNRLMDENVETVLVRNKPKVKEVNSHRFCFS